MDINFYVKSMENFTILSVVWYERLTQMLPIAYCKDQFRLRSNTGMDPGPRSPNNEFVECGKKS